MAAAEQQYEESYSLWVMPKGAVKEQLQKEMQRLAEEHAGPKFPPHVTVLGDIKASRDEVVAVAERMAQQLKKYRINFLDAARGTFYYQCVFLACAKDEGTLAAAALARQLYSMTTGPYMPHLSLLYADLEDGHKEAVAAGSRQRLFGEGSGYDTLLADPGFTAESIAVWYTPTEDKSLNSWRMVAELQLQ